MRLAEAWKVDDAADAQPIIRDRNPKRITERVATMNEPTLKLRSKDGAAAGATPVEQATLTSDELRKTDAYWRAAN